MLKPSHLATAAARILPTMTAPKPMRNARPYGIVIASRVRQPERAEYGIQDSRNRLIEHQGGGCTQGHGEKGSIHFLFFLLAAGVRPHVALTGPASVY